MSVELGPQTKDLTGKRFGNLLVLGLVGYKGTHKAKRRVPIWQWRCDCGIEFVRRAFTKNDKSFKLCASCACKKAQAYRVQSSKDKNSKHVAAWYLTRVKQSAKKRGRLYDITLQDAEDQWVKQNGECGLTGLSLTPTSDFTYRSLLLGDINTASLDRVDSKKGYIVGNIEWVHKHVNVWKLDHSREYYIELSILVAEKAKRDKKEKQ